MANIFDILFNRKPKKPDFSNVDSRTTQSGAGGSGGSIRPDFSRTANRQDATPGADFRNVNTNPRGADFRNVDSSVTSSERPVGGGGSGGTGTFGPRTYTVVAGDTLSHIAQRFYGKASRWPAIFDANRDKLSDPDRIFPGQVLRIPADDDTTH
jgi:nucleoid-associated protein YgaU